MLQFLQLAEILLELCQNLYISAINTSNIGIKTNFDKNASTIYVYAGYKNAKYSKKYSFFIKPHPNIHLPFPLHFIFEEKNES